MRYFLIICVLLSVIGCRKDKAPPIDICEGDGSGGCDGTKSTGEHFSLLPSQLKNAWIIPDPEQAKAFVDFCFNVPASELPQGSIVTLPSGVTYVTP